MDDLTIPPPPQPWQRKKKEPPVVPLLYTLIALALVAMLYVGVTT